MQAIRYFVKLLFVVGVVVLAGLHYGDFKRLISDTWNNAHGSSNPSSPITGAFQALGSAANSAIGGAANSMGR
jgi:hypothetical protein